MNEAKAKCPRMIRFLLFKSQIPYASGTSHIPHAWIISRWTAHGCVQKSPMNILYFQISPLVQPSLSLFLLLLGSSLSQRTDSLGAHDLPKKQGSRRETQFVGMRFEVCLRIQLRICGWMECFFKKRCIYIYVYICICTYIHIYIYTYLYFLVTRSMKKIRCNKKKGERKKSKSNISCKICE